MNLSTHKKRLWTTYWRRFTWRNSVRWNLRLSTKTFSRILQLLSSPLDKALSPSRPSNTTNVKCKLFSLNWSIISKPISEFLKFSTLQIMKFHRPLLTTFSKQSPTRRAKTPTKKSSKTFRLIIFPNLLTCWRVKAHKFKKISFWSTGRKTFCQGFWTSLRLLWGHWKLRTFSNRWECHWGKTTKCRPRK